MSAKLPWFRMYTEFATDPDVQCLAFDDQRHYVVLLCMKGAGVLDKQYPSAEHRERVVRRALGLDAMTAGEARRRLVDAGLIDSEWQPLGWTKRQFASDHDRTAAERQRRRRERLSNGRVTRDVTRESLRPDTDTDTEIPPAPTGLPPADPGASSPAKPRQGRRLPEDFALTPERILVAEAETLPAEETFRAFVDHWRAEAGQRARKLDWDAAWRTWCRREREFQARRRPAGQGKGGAPLTKFERIFGETDRG